MIEPAQSASTAHISWHAQDDQRRGRRARGENSAPLFSAVSAASAVDVVTRVPQRFPRRALCLLGAAGLLLTLTPGRAAAQGAAADDRPAEAVYKNIKALKGTPASQLNQSMHLIKGAL